MSVVTKPLALLGGTFDPVHYAHLRCAEAVRKSLGVDTIYLLPAGNPPHRATPEASNNQRLEMLRLAGLPDRRCESSCPSTDLLASQRMVIIQNL